MAALTAFGVLQHSPLIFGQNWVYSNQDSGFCLMLQQEIYHSPSHVPRPSCEFGNLTRTHLTWHGGRGEIVNGAADSCYSPPSAGSKWNVCTQHTRHKNSLPNPTSIFRSFLRNILHPVNQNLFSHDIQLLQRRYKKLINCFVINVHEESTSQISFNNIISDFHWNVKLFRWTRDVSGQSVHSWYYMKCA